MLSVCVCIWVGVLCMWCVSNKHAVFAQCSECQSGEANDWRNREHVVLDLFSNLKMGKILWKLWFISRASDNYVDQSW